MEAQLVTSLIELSTSIVVIATLTGVLIARRIAS